MLWLWLGCASEAPSDPAAVVASTPTVPTTDTHTGSTPVYPTSTGTTGDTGTAPFTATLTVERRADLATWLGFDVAFSGSEAATLSCISDDDPTERHVRSVVAGPTGFHGLLADHPYTCSVTRPADGAVGATVAARTDPLPAALPTFSRSGTSPNAEMLGRWTVMSGWRTTEGIQRALIVDPDGRLRWYKALDANTAGTTVTWADGTLLAGGGQALPPTVLDLDGETLFQAPFPTDPLEVHHHECRRVDGSHVLGVVSDVFEHDSDEDGATESYEGFRIEVHDPATGALVWSYVSADRLDQWMPKRWNNVDLYHTNAVTWEDDGTSWVSLRALDQVRLLDRTSGEVLLTLGDGGDVRLLDAAGERLDDSEWFSGQHAPEVHGDRMFLMDNGTPQRGFSRAIELVVDRTARTATRVWEWTEPGWFDPYYGSVNLLSSGHVLVGAGHCSRCDGTGGTDRFAFVAEVDPATNEVLWRLDFTNGRDSLFRAQAVDGCDIFANEKYCTP